MQITPYLNYDGDCRQAFEFYERCFGGKIEMMLTYGDSPGNEQCAQAEHGKITHACLFVGEAMLMASDAPKGQYEKPAGTYVSLSVDKPADADRIFRELSEKGGVTMPMQQTFFAERFGMCIDRWGIPWMIISQGSVQFSG